MLLFTRNLNFASLLAVLGGLFAFSEGIWSDAAHGFFYRILDDWYLLLQEQSLLLISIIVLLTSIGIKGRREFLLISIAFLSIGFYEYIVSLFFNTGYYGFLSFLNGFLFPVFLVWFLLRTNNQRLYFRYFYIGAICFIGVALIILLFFDTNSSFLREHSLGEVLLSLRSRYQDSLFFLLVGNANKQSNYLLMSLLLGPSLLELKGPSKLYSLFVIFAVILLFLLCSRATLMLLPIALFLNRKYFMPVSKKSKMIFAASALFVTGLLFNHFMIVFKYVVLNTKLGNDNLNVLGTMHYRFAQWSDVMNIISEPATLIHGIGNGNYGLIYENDAIAGTHNLFIDHLLASGLYGVIVLSTLIIYGIKKSLLLEDKRILVSYLFFLCLAFREYTFAYIYVTSMGGLIFVFMLYLTSYAPIQQQSSP